MFVVDVMHDFELGDWRVLFIHLLRILDAVDSSLVVELDRRWVVYLSWSDITFILAGPGISRYLRSVRMRSGSFAQTHRR